MKRWFRPIAYSTIALLVILAVFGDEAPAEAAAVLPTVSTHAPAAVQRAAEEPLPEIRKRKAAAFPSALFAAEQAVVAPVVVSPVTIAAPPPVEIKVLGWMVSDATPYAFIEWKGASHTLALNEVAGDTIRFDAVSGGLASFTYLPTGEVRQYPVSNPDAQE